MIYKNCNGFSSNQSAAHKGIISVDINYFDAIESCLQKGII